ncbi:MAG: ribose-5-phosphate isomerase RpiA [Pseudomonadota bacterium]
MARNSETGATDPRRAAAATALRYVESGMRIGVGAGSISAVLIDLLAARARRGLDVFCVPTSRHTRDLAEKRGLRTGGLDEAGWLDITIDSADEFDVEMNLIKGGGGGLLREKIVASASDRMVVITDQSRHVDRLGAFPLPVEVAPFGWEVTRSILQDLASDEEVAGDQISLRMNRDDPFVTEDGHYILDLHLRRIVDPVKLTMMLNRVPGVVENGLFVGIADVIVVGKRDGTADVLSKSPEDDLPPEDDGLFDDLS